MPTLGSKRYDLDISEIVYQYFDEISDIDNVTSIEINAVDSARNSITGDVFYRVEEENN